MKIKRLLYNLFIIMMFLLCVAGCGEDMHQPKKQSKAYGLTEGGFVCEISLERNQSGKICTMGIEEYYMPMYFFRADNYNIETLDGKQVKKVVDANGNEVEYVVNTAFKDEEFELYCIEFRNEDGASFEPKRYTVDYKSDRKKSLNTYIATDDGGKWYVASLKNGDVTIGIKQDDKYQAVAEAFYNGGINKSTTGFGTDVSDGSKGWALNMQLIKTQLIKEFNHRKINGITDAEIERMRINSGATVSAFGDYVKIAIKAYEKMS